MILGMLQYKITQISGLKKIHLTVLHQPKNEHFRTQNSDRIAQYKNVEMQSATKGMGRTFRIAGA